jgi:hypothetical protein
LFLDLFQNLGEFIGERGFQPYRGLITWVGKGEAMSMEKEAFQP